MYLSPLSVKTKHARVGSFTTCLGCPRFRERKCALSHSEHKQNRQFYNMSRLLFRLNTPEGRRGREGSRTPVQTDYFIHTVHSCKCSDDQSEHSI